MQKKKAARLVGFVGALCASGALVGFSVSGTGAYFTDSHAGQINTTTGHVKVNTSDLSLNFNGLLPGQYQTQTINYQAAGTGQEDIWMVFPTDGSAAALGIPTGNGLGRYGHLQVTSAAGSFVSDNLNGPTDQCGVDQDGHGGSDQTGTFNYQGESPSGGTTVPYCPVPNAILLQRNMNSGDTGSTSVEFGFTRMLRSGQDGAASPLARFKIVATQAGVRPDDPNNPAGVASSATPGPNS